MENVRRFKCDPASWTPEELSQSNHVTAAKHPPGSRERLQRVLWEHPRIWRHLCALAQALDYELPMPCPPPGGEAGTIMPGSGAGVGQQVQAQQRYGQQQQALRAQQERIMEFMQRKAELGEQVQRPQAEQQASAEQQQQRQQALAEQQALMEQQPAEQGPLLQQAEQQAQEQSAQQVEQQAQQQPGQQAGQQARATEVERQAQQAGPEALAAAGEQQQSLAGSTQLTTA